MEELVIEDKKYVSSKRAAKVTGYAKDYVGQLCREGRVPARLVGRAWYVLESAIQDHRFGEQNVQHDMHTDAVGPGDRAEWESPRYEAADASVLPFAQNAYDVEPADAPTNPESNSAHHLKASWQEWFDRIAETQRPTSEIVAITPEVEAKTIEVAPISPVEVIQEGESVPVRSIIDRLPPEELLPHRAIEIPLSIVHMPSQRGSDAPIRFMQVTACVIAILAITLAALSSGYFDTYLISNRQASLPAGISLYNQ